MLCESVPVLILPDYPIAALPLTTLEYNGRPIGLSAVAPAHKEALLFQLMAAWESSFPARAQPTGYATQRPVRSEL